MRFVFDLDNCLSLCGTPEKGYCDALPNLKLITYARQLKQEGHTLVLATARGMKRSGGNLPSIKCDAFVEVAKWLSIHNLTDLFDEVHFDKPYGECYIDDKAVPAGMADLLGNSLISVKRLLVVLNSEEGREAIRELL